MSLTASRWAGRRVAQAVGAGGWGRRLGGGGARGPAPCTAIAPPIRTPIPAGLLLAAGPHAPNRPTSLAPLTITLLPLPLSSCASSAGVVPRLRPGRVPLPQRVGAVALAREEGRGVRPGEGRRSGGGGAASHPARSNEARHSQPAATSRLPPPAHASSLQPCDWKHKEKGDRWKWHGEICQCEWGSGQPGRQAHQMWARRRCRCRRPLRRLTALPCPAPPRPAVKADREYTYKNFCEIFT